ncbi:MAG: hypothetical protein FJ303_10690 [Planctomycetes bacterium]|nr:hypothetical protein [Planctomycetota bacterium]
MVRQTVILVVLLGVASSVLTAEAQGKKRDKRVGTVEGVLTEKKLDRPCWVTVKADGEETPRRYWGYGATPSAEMRKQLDAVAVGSRVRLVWEVIDANEGPHVAKIELIQKEKTKGGEKKTGVVVGVLLDRTYGKGVLVKADGEETPRRYWRFGDRANLNKQIDAVPIGARVRLTWEVPHANEGPHVAKIEILKASDKDKAK